MPWSSRFEDAPDGEPQRRRGRRALVVSLVVLAASLPVAAYAVDRIGADRLAAGTTVGGVAVGGMASADAVAAIERELADPLHRPLTVTAPGMTRETTAWDIGLRIDARAAVADELRAQRSRLLPARMVSLFTGGAAVALEPSLDEGLLATFLGDAAAQVSRAAVDSSFTVTDGWLKIVPAQAGRELDVAGAEEAVRTAIGSGSVSVDLPVRQIRPKQDERRLDTAILVHTASNMLYLYERGKITETYRVATGARGFSTPTGTWRITAKRRNPTWGNPGSAWARSMPRFIGPGPNNPLGTRAMNLDVRGIRIHGTSDARSIGTHASHGCIRMHLGEAEELFERVAVDTPVVIVRA